MALYLDPLGYGLQGPLRRQLSLAAIMARTTRDARPVGTIMGVGSYRHKVRQPKTGDMV